MGVAAKNIRNGCSGLEVFTLPDDKCEVRGEEDDIELLESGEDAAEALDPSKQPPNLIAFQVRSCVS
jgi:hypothetical protein